MWQNPGHKPPQNHNFYGCFKPSTKSRCPQIIVNLAIIHQLYDPYANPMKSQCCWWIQHLPMVSWVQWCWPIQWMKRWIMGDSGADAVLAASKGLLTPRRQGGTHDPPRRGKWTTIAAFLAICYLIYPCKVVKRNILNTCREGMITYLGGLPYTPTCI